MSEGEKKAEVGGKTAIIIRSILRDHSRSEEGWMPFRRLRGALVDAGVAPSWIRRTLNSMIEQGEVSKREEPEGYRLHSTQLSANDAPKADAMSLLPSSVEADDFDAEMADLMRQQQEALLGEEGGEDSTTVEPAKDETPVVQAPGAPTEGVAEAAGELAPEAEAPRGDAEADSGPEPVVRWERTAGPRQRAEANRGKRFVLERISDDDWKVTFPEGGVICDAAGVVQSTVPAGESRTFPSASAAAMVLTARRSVSGRQWWGIDATTTSTRRRSDKGRVADLREHFSTFPETTLEDLPAVVQAWLATARELLG